MYGPSPYYYQDPFPTKPYEFSQRLYSNDYFDRTAPSLSNRSYCGSFCDHRPYSSYPYPASYSNWDRSYFNNPLATRSYDSYWNRGYEVPRPYIPPPPLYEDRFAYNRPSYRSPYMGVPLERPIIDRSFVRPTTERFYDPYMRPPPMDREYDPYISHSTMLPKKTEVGREYEQKYEQNLSKSTYLQEEPYERNEQPPYERNEKPQYERNEHPTYVRKEQPPYGTYRRNEQISFGRNEYPPYGYEQTSRDVRYYKQEPPAGYKQTEKKKVYDDNHFEISRDSNPSPRMAKPNQSQTQKDFPQKMFKAKEPPMIKKEFETPPNSFKRKI